MDTCYRNRTYIKKTYRGDINIIITNIKLNNYDNNSKFN